MLLHLGLLDLEHGVVGVEVAGSIGHLVLELRELGRFIKLWDLKLRFWQLGLDLDGFVVGDGGFVLL